MSGSQHVTVAIVGGGFGGIYAAKGLARHGVDVAIIDTHGSQTFQPMLYQAATGIVALDDIVYPLEDLHGVRAVKDTVASIDLTAKELSLASGSTLTADYLVIATGCSVNFFGVTGAADHAYPLYTADDAKRIWTRGGELFARSEQVPIAVVGAGATGVEITGALLDVADDLLPRSFPGFHREQIELHVIDHASVPLAAMSAKSQSYAQEVLARSGVTFHLGRSVTEVTGTDVGLDDGTRLPSGMTIWAGGLSVRVPQMAPAPRLGPRGRLAIDADLRMPGHDHVYCLGDAAADPQQPLPQLGSFAKQQGIAVAKAIRRQLVGKEPKPFSYQDLGDMAMVRHDAATVEVGKHHHPVDGPVAFAMWLGLHAYLLPGDDHRGEALRSWSKELLTGKSTYLEPKKSEA